MKPADALDSTADYIDEHGWQDGYGEHGGPRCVSGALHSVVTATRTKDRKRLNGPVFPRRGTPSDDFLGAWAFLFKQVSGPVLLWNASSNQSEVVATLRRAADKVRETEAAKEAEAAKESEQ